MNFRNWATIALAAAAISIQLFAQDNPSQQHKARHQQYQVYDVGTFGGPDAAFWGGYPYGKTLNKRGIVVGAASTTTPDPFYPNCAFSDCLVGHPYQYRDGVLTDLGTLGASTNSAIAHGSNDRGWIVGVAENGQIDPLTGFPESRGVLWTRGGIADLGTFGGNIGHGLDLNNRGQVVGGAENTVPDAYAIGIVPFYFEGFPLATQMRAFLWQNEVMQDLGTLGGNDAAADLINDNGQVAGTSYTNTVPNPTTGFPTEDPFFWENGRMVDIGTLGGTFGYPNWMNCRGQVVGLSNVAGDQASHPFLWDRGVLTDLGTLGGSAGGANWINDEGDATGYGYLAGDQIFHGVLWKRGRKTDLGGLPGFPLSEAFAINSEDQIAGTVATADVSVLHAVLWEDGSIVDLNAFVPPDSGVTLQIAAFINDRGEIVASGVLANGDNRVYLLVPHGDCDDDCERRITDNQNNPAVGQPARGAVRLPAFGKPANSLAGGRGLSLALPK